MYRVAFRRELNLLDIEWFAMFEPDAVGDYARKLRDQFDAEGFAPGYLLRMDMRRSGVQAQDAVAPSAATLPASRWPAASPSSPKARSRGCRSAAR